MVMIHLRTKFRMKLLPAVTTVKQHGKYRFYVTIKLLYNLQKFSLTKDVYF
jgi:hypothetical protein